MLLQRTLVTVILLPLGIAAIVAGGAWFALLVALILGLAAREYAGLFRSGGLQPASFLIVGGVLVIAAGRYIYGFEQDATVFTVLVMASLVWHLRAYEAGRDEAGTDFATTISGIFYIGLLGSYMLALRALPDGEWWLLLALPSLWLADSAAYFFGTKFGKHKLAPRLSPKKSWEGYFSGVVFGALGGPLLLLLYRSLGLPDGAAFTTANAAWLGLAMGVLPTLGDLGESMIKRQVGVKDSSSLLPGHGGMFDRIDSWLWALPIGYYLILWMTH
jgi:phosphatidate cytidylyltransferase